MCFRNVCLSSTYAGPQMCSSKTGCVKGPAAMAQQDALQLDAVVVRAGLQRPDLLASASTADTTISGTSLHSRTAADVGAVAVGEPELDDDGVGHAQRRTVERIGVGARHVHVEISVAQHPP
jgi:hypothetical protein